MRSFFISSLFLAITLLTNNSYAEDCYFPNSYKDELICRANTLKLYEDPEWIALLHYKKDLFGGYESMAESGSLFFNSPEGKRDPKSELSATLEKFFSKEERIEGNDTQPYQCAFIARYSWLKIKLDFDKRRLIETPCKRYTDWYRGINPYSISLIFPSTYVNNPASAFGHTLLRINQPDQDERTRLLAYTAHYAAQTGGENALFYAIKGIFGGYPGFFSVAPYYEKVKKYSDLEKRDIWEYHLNLTHAEITTIVKHIWELRGIPFSYYYFDENCSYHLLSLLDVARPSFSFLKDSGIWVLPVDTLRAVGEKEGLIASSVFRPSVLTKLNYGLTKMPKDERVAVKSLVNEGKDSREYQTLSPESKAKVSDIAYEYLNYRVLSGKSELQKPAYELLRERSSLPQIEPVEVPRPKYMPQESHNTARIGAGIGREKDNWFYDLRYRGVYHDLMDPNEGFNDGSQIELLDAVFRQLEEGAFRLERADLVDIISLSPRNDLIKPLSWNINFGFDRQYFPDEEKHLFFKIEGGFGPSWRLSEKILAYSILDLSAKFDDDFQDKYALGVKPIAGAYYDLSSAVRFGIKGSYSNYFEGDSHEETLYGAEERITLGRDSALRIECRNRKEFSERSNEWFIAIDYYL